MATQSRVSKIVGSSSGPRESSDGELFTEEVEATSTGERSRDEEKFKLPSTALPTGRLVGKGLCGIVYETAREGRRFARKDFIEVPGEIFGGEALGLSRLGEHVNVVNTYHYTVGSRCCSLLLEYMDDDLLGFLQKKKESKRRLLGNSSETSRRISRQEFMTVSRKSSAVSVPPTCPPPLDLPEALDIMLQIATGMEYLHEKKIAHGDLKPRNVLLRYSNEGEKLVKVSDFGLIQSKSKSMYFVSHRARMFDVALWKAPEYLRMCKFDETSAELDEDEDMASDINYDGELLRGADVYSFAMTCFQILTGRIPFYYQNWKDLVMRKTGPEGLKPTLLPTFEPKLVKLLESCWVGSTQDRPTFSAICEELREIMIISDSSPDWADWSVFDSPKPQDPSINFQDAVAGSEPSPGAHSVSSVGEIKPNTDPSTIESDTAVTDSPSNKRSETPDNLFDNVSFEVEKGYPSPESPVDDEYLPSPMKNKDADSGSKSKSTRSPIVRVPSDDGSPKPIQPVYSGDGDSEFDFAIPDEAKTTYSIHFKWKKAFAGIPSKTHHLGVVSVQFCKSKTRAVVDSCHALRRSYPGDLDFPPYPGDV